MINKKTMEELKAILRKSDGPLSSEQLRELAESSYEAALASAWNALLKEKGGSLLHKALIEKTAELYGSNPPYARSRCTAFLERFAIPDTADPEPGLFSGIPARKKQEVRKKGSCIHTLTWEGEKEGFGRMTHQWHRACEVQYERNSSFLEVLYAMNKRECDEYNPNAFRPKKPFLSRNKEELTNQAMEHAEELDGWWLGTGYDRAATEKIIHTIKKAIRQVQGPKMKFYVGEKRPHEGRF